MDAMAAQTRRRGDTRGDIQRTALRLFNTQGYDKTSLREIAEDLGLTKAALYYHFPTKDDILESLLRDVAASLDELIVWARSEPSTRERRLEFLERLGAATRGGTGDLMRCVQQNELAIAGMPGAMSIVRRYKKELADAILPPDADVEGRLRVRLAVMAVLVGGHGSADLGGTDDERHDAALRIAAEVMP
ncbi:TetR family transcriptional regulator [Actinotalea fermentans]|uniref:TetR family transcriptional regulator n=2 Tax=Actinotalea fermentans TaxID=43671 RepID=A0A511YYI8_9CELL|nr:TetR family transcriptional regulator [Actinotalea fermentans]